MTNKKSDNTGKKYLVKITPQQQKFIENYCSHYGEWSATRCAMEAGYAKDSAHTRANELLNWKINPEVRKEIDVRLADARQVWEVTRDKSMANLFRIGHEAGVKGQYGVKAKCEELRGRLAGLYIEKQMVLSKELSESDLDEKWKQMFSTKEEMIEINNQLVKELWDDDKKDD